jgi:outer membrane receptor for ferrienterochelin and colicins
MITILLWYYLQTQNPNGVEPLKQVMVVTGTGRPELLVEAPVRTELVSGEMIRQQAARTVGESLVATVPGLRLENNCQNCGFGAIRLNGLEGPYTQVLEDGMPAVSGATMVYALDQLPAQFYESIEVVKGGASALYGPNAVAGVVNLVRREPAGNHFEVNWERGWNRGRPEGTVGVMGQAGNLGKGWAGDFYYRQAGRTHLDVDRDGFTELPRLSGQAGGATVFRRFREDRARLTLGGSALGEFRRGGSQLDLRPEQTWITEQLNSRREAGFARWNHALSPELYYSVSTSFSQFRRASYYGAGMDENAYGDTGNPLSVTDATLGWQRGRHGLSAGGQMWWERVRDVYQGYGRDIRQTFRNTGLFVQDEWRVNRRVVLLGGARVDKSNLLDHVVVSPRGNLRVGLGKDWNLRVGFSTGFRAPQVFDEDLHIASVGGEVLLIQRARNLREERSLSWMGAVDYVGRRGQFGVNWFQTRLRDVFVLGEVEVEDNRLFERRNGPGAAFTGVEVSGAWKVNSRVRTRGGWTAQRARYDEPEPVFGSRRYLRTPNLHGFGGVDVDLPGKLAWVNTLEMTGPMRVPHFAGFIPEDRLAESGWFAVWSSVVSRDFAVRDKGVLKVYVRANNIGNSYQRDFDRGPLRDAGYIYGPMLPRGVRAGMTWRF